MVQQQCECIIPLQPLSLEGEQNDVWLTWSQIEVMIPGCWALVGCVLLTMIHQSSQTSHGNWFGWERTTGASAPFLEKWLKVDPSGLCFHTTATTTLLDHLWSMFSMKSHSGQETQRIPYDTLTVMSGLPLSNMSIFSSIYFSTNKLHIFLFEDDCWCNIEKDWLTSTKKLGIRIVYAVVMRTWPWITDGWSKCDQNRFGNNELCQKKTYFLLHALTQT